MIACLHSREKAFSLFEIVVAMAILGIIAGSVLSILWQAGDTAAEIRYLDRRDEEVSRFVTLLRESIENLPDGATMQMIPAEESVSGVNELMIGNSPTAFLFGEKIGMSEETVIALRPAKELRAAEPSFEIAISRSDFAPDEDEDGGMVFRAGEDDFLQSDEEGRYWLPLLGELSGASWRFWDEDQQEWLDEWTDDSAMPPLLEFSLTDLGAAVPMTVVFEVPDSVVNPDQSQNGAATTTTTTSTSGSVQTSGGGGDRGRQRGEGDRRPGGSDRRPDGGADEGRRPGSGDRPNNGNQRPSGGGRPGGGNASGGDQGGGGRQ